MRVTILVEVDTHMDAWDIREILTDRLQRGKAAATTLPVKVLAMTAPDLAPDPFNLPDEQGAV